MKFYTQLLFFTALVFLTSACVEAPPNKPPVDPIITSYKIGDRIQLVKFTNVRSSAGIQSTNLLGTQQIGAVGTIMEGPSKTADNFIWWKVDFESGVDGFAGEDNYSFYSDDDDGGEVVSHPIAVNDCVSGSATVIRQHGITWTFDKAYSCGQFANGDYWVVGPVKITKITPFDSVPGDTVDRHGSMINPLAGHAVKQGFDSRMQSKNYNQTLNVARTMPLIVANNSSLLSSVSFEAQTTGDKPQLDTIAILTVLGNAPAEHSFRPAYQGPDKSIPGNASQLKYSALRSLAPVASAPSLSSVESLFEKPYIEISTSWVGRYHHPKNNYPSIFKDKDASYGREMTHTLAAGLLSLQLNYSNSEKQTLYIRMVQAGLDIYGAVANGAYWGDGGGHNIGRKMTMILAGKALGRNDILSAGDTKNKYIFSEDHQTFFVTQADIDRYHVVPSSARNNIDKQFIPYTQADIGLAEWGFNHKDQSLYDNNNWNAIYREVVGPCMLGQVLTAHLMGVKSTWNHPALFDYFDRYYAIDGAKVGVGSNAIHPFVSEMWKAYR